MYITSVKEAEREREIGEIWQVGEIWKAAFYRRYDNTCARAYRYILSNRQRRLSEHDRWRSWKRENAPKKKEEISKRDLIGRCFNRDGTNKRKTDQTRRGGTNDDFTGNKKKKKTKDNDWCAGLRRITRITIFPFEVRLLIILTSLTVHRIKYNTFQCEASGKGKLISSFSFVYFDPSRASGF